MTIHEGDDDDDENDRDNCADDLAADGRDEIEEWLHFMIIGDWPMALHFFYANRF